MSKFYSFVKNQKYSFYGSFIYFLSKNVNLIPEFKLYLEDDKLICFDIIHPKVIPLFVKNQRLFVFYGLNLMKIFKTFYIISSKINNSLKKTLCL
ncbi:hypothetical protein I9Q28_03025 [Campylobacter lari]|nr:hypothetical protein [Campylobacter lari]MBX1934445.1 hypothetical protein [Campylobacter lari]